MRPGPSLSRLSPPPPKPYFEETERGPRYWPGVLWYAPLRWLIVTLMTESWRSLPLSASIAASASAAERGRVTKEHVLPRLALSLQAATACAIRVPTHALPSTQLQACTQLLPYTLHECPACWLARSPAYTPCTGIAESLFQPKASVCGASSKWPFEPCKMPSHMRAFCKIIVQDTQRPCRNAAQHSVHALDGHVELAPPCYGGTGFPLYNVHEGLHALGRKIGNRGWRFL